MIKRSMAKKSIPRSGSLAYKPKVRAERIYPDEESVEVTVRVEPASEFDGGRLDMWDWRAE